MNPSPKDIRPNPFQSFFDEQKAYFQTKATKSYESHPGFSSRSNRNDPSGREYRRGPGHPRRNYARWTPLGLRRKVRSYAFPTPTSYAAPRTAKSRAWIVIGTT